MGIQEVVQTLNGTTTGVKWQKSDKSVDVCPWWYTKLPAKNHEFPFSFNKNAVEFCPVEFYPKSDRTSMFYYGSRMLIYDYSAENHDGVFNVRFSTIGGDLLYHGSMEIQNE